MRDANDDANICKSIPGLGQLVQICCRCGRCRFGDDSVVSSNDYRDDDGYDKNDVFVGHSGITNEFSMLP